MERVTKEIIIDFLKENKVELTATHRKLCLPVINRIFKKLSVGIKFSAIKIENDLICDGHHRFIASILAGVNIETIPGRSSSATAAIDWQSVDFEEEDWDTPAKIEMLNQQDADYNNIPIERLVELLK